MFHFDIVKLNLTLIKANDYHVSAYYQLRGLEFVPPEAPIVQRGIIQQRFCRGAC